MKIYQIKQSERRNQLNLYRGEKLVHILEDSKDHVIYQEIVKCQDFQSACALLLDKDQETFPRYFYVDMLNELHDKFEYDHLVKLSNQIDDVLQKLNYDQYTGFINHFFEKYFTNQHDLKANFEDAFLALCQFFEQHQKSFLAKPIKISKDNLKSLFKLYLQDHNECIYQILRHLDAVDAHHSEKSDNVYEGILRNAYLVDLLSNMDARKVIQCSMRLKVSNVTGLSEMDAVLETKLKDSKPIDVQKIMHGLQADEFKFCSNYLPKTHQCLLEKLDFTQLFDFKVMSLDDECQSWGRLSYQEKHLFFTKRKSSILASDFYTDLEIMEYNRSFASSLISCAVFALSVAYLPVVTQLTLLLAATVLAMVTFLILSSIFCLPLKNEQENLQAQYPGRDLSY